MFYDEEAVSRRTLEVLTIKDLMDYLAIGKNTAYRLILSGEIKSFKIGRIHKIPIKSVVEYIEKKRRAR